MNYWAKIMNIESFFSKINQKILGLLCEHPNESFYSNQIAEKIGLSNGGVSQSLRVLAKDNLLIHRIAFNDILTRL